MKKKGSYKNLKRVFPYMGPYKAAFILGTIALLCTAGLSLLFPFYLKEFLGNVTDAQVINRVLITLLIILAIQGLITYVRIRFMGIAIEKMVRDLRTDIFEDLLRLPLSFYHEYKPGLLTGGMVHDLSVIKETLQSSLAPLGRHLVILIGGLCFVFVISWQLSVLLLLIIIPVVALLAIFGKKVKKHTHGAQEALEESESVLEESVQNISEVKAFCNESYEAVRYTKTLDAYIKAAFYEIKARSWFVAFVIFVMFGSIACIVWRGAHLVIAGDLTEKQLTGFILFSVFVAASLRAIPEVLAQFQRADVATKRLFRIKDLAQEQQAAQTGSQELELDGSLSLKNIEFAYSSNPDEAVLNKVSFDIAAGQSVAIVGESGAGKSTLISLLYGFYTNYKGEISYNGIDIKELDIAKFRSQLAMVSQEVLLFGGSIAQNIAYGNADDTQEQIQQAAIQAHADEFITEFPEGYETLVGPRGVKLSGGQRQRIALARAILTNPKILFLDEATSALDAETEGKVQDALEQLSQGRTTITIAHRLATIKSADMILVFKDGCLIEQGKHTELIAASGYYNELVSKQNL